MSPFDSEIVDRAARAFELTEYQVLHPSMLFRVLSRVHKDRQPALLGEVLRHVRLEASGAGRPGLPQRYVAVSVAFSEALPRSEDNEAFLAGLVGELAAERDVVIVDAPLPGLVLPASPRLHRLDPPDGDGDPVAVQAQAIAGAEAFFGAHGDLAILAAFCGTPAVTYHSERLPADRLERLQTTVASAGWAPVTIERARRFKGVRLPVGAN
jgi:hypothetical protein